MHLIAGAASHEAAFPIILPNVRNTGGISYILRICIGADPTRSIMIAAHGVRLSAEWLIIYSAI